MEARDIKQTIVSRRQVASYADYPSAQAAVDYLAEADYPVERVTIAAEGIRLVERVTGRYGWVEAGMTGLLIGALGGALFGAVFGALSLIAPVAAALELALLGAIYGGVIGMIISLALYAGRRRRYRSTAAIQAERYELLVDEPFADEAARLLRRRSDPAVLAA